MPKKTRKKKKTVAKKKKAAKRPSKKKRVVKKAKAGPELPSEPVGRVTHYFPKVKATAIMIERDRVRVGDTLYFKGHTTRFKQQVESMQLEHQAVSEASPGQEIGIRTRSRTRERDLVFKL